MRSRARCRAVPVCDGMFGSTASFAAVAAGKTTRTAVPYPGVLSTTFPPPPCVTTRPTPLSIILRHAARAPGKGFTGFEKAGRATSHLVESKQVVPIAREVARLAERPIDALEARL